MEEMHYFSTRIRIAVFKQNVFVGLHETGGDPLENVKDLQNRVLLFAAYKQFIWWIF